MTTPNIEELIAKLRTSMGDLDCPNTYEFAMHQAADALQSQAERISGLEKEVAFQIKMKEQHCKRLSDERDTLRAQLAAIAATAPVAEVGGTFTLYWVGSGPIEPIVKKYGIKVGDKLFTRPMPAQDVAELVDALEMIVSTHQGHCEHHVGVSKHSYNLADIAEEALSKYKGAKL